MRSQELDHSLLHREFICLCLIISNIKYISRGFFIWGAFVRSKINFAFAQFAERIISRFRSLEMELARMDGGIFRLCFASVFFLAACGYYFRHWQPIK